MTDLPIHPLTAEHKMIRDAARDFAQKEISPIAAEHDESGEFPHATMKKMGEMGFMGIEVPEQYGGAGFDSGRQSKIFRSVGSRRTDYSPCTCCSTSDGPAK